MHNMYLFGYHVCIHIRCSFICLQIQGLKSYLLHYAIVQCTSASDLASSSEPAAAALRSTILAALAVLIKRSWLDADSRMPSPAVDGAFFQASAPRDEATNLSGRAPYEPPPMNHKYHTGMQRCISYWHVAPAIKTGDDSPDSLGGVGCGPTSRVRAARCNRC
jgi:hypothetical protein